MGIFLLIIIFVFLFSFIYFSFQLAFVKRQFKDCNTLTFGKKGHGKDVFFALVIHARKKKHYANIPYDKNTTILHPRQYSITPNTYQNFIEGKVIKIPKILQEGYDYYVSDGGIVLPSQYDSVLDKVYPSFPLAYALSRQLWGSNVHVNSQSIERPWKKIREQADSFFLCQSCVKLPFFLLLNVRFYDKYNSALQELAPLKNLFLNKYAKANKAMYVAQNGSIRNLHLLCPKRWLTYDTRYFHSVIFGDKYVKPKKLNIILFFKSVRSKCINTFRKKMGGYSKGHRPLV